MTQAWISHQQIIPIIAMKWHDSAQTLLNGLFNLKLLFSVECLDFGSNKTNKEQ